MKPQLEVIRIADLIENRLQDLVDASGPDELCALLLVAARVIARQVEQAGEGHLTEGAKIASALFLDFVKHAAESGRND